MSDETTSKADDFAAKIAKSVGRAIGEDGTIQSIDPKEIEGEPAEPKALFVPNRTTSSELERKKHARENPAPPESEFKEPDDPPAAPVVHGEPKVEPKPADPAPKEEPKPAAVKVTKVSSTALPGTSQQSQPAPTPQPAAAQAPQPPAASTTPTPDPDANLTDEQRDEIAFATFAEKANPERYRGRVDQTRSYFKKLDEFVTAHPDIEPDSEDFKEWLGKNRPAWETSERNKLERQMIREETLASFKEDQAKRDAEIQRELHDVKVRPKVEKEALEFQQQLASETLQIPEGAERISPDGVKAVMSRVAQVGVESAIREFPIEGPIVVGTVRASNAFLNLVNGLEAYNPYDPTHTWLSKFIDAEGARMAAAPESVRVRNGKSFIPRSEWARIADQSPAEASKYWTFDDKQVLEMLAVNAHLAYHQQVETLTKSGFSRKKPESQTPPPESKNGHTPAEPSPNGSPKAAPRASPGAADRSVRKVEHADFFETIAPGSSSKLG